MIVKKFLKAIKEDQLIVINGFHPVGIHTTTKPHLKKYIKNEYMLKRSINEVEITDNVLTLHTNILDDEMGGV